jgi:anthranilate synthase/aminodeoxychorismate synthase-like glutamine amidotransferase
MILLIDNYDSFTWNLVQRLGEIDASLTVERDLRVIRNDQIRADEIETLHAGGPPTHIIISPGPCTPSEAGVSVDVLRRFEGRVPILGVCLGHQCMAAGNGMTVRRHVLPMHGKTSEIHHDGRGVFAGLSNPFVATRYHSLVVDAETIPACAPGEDGWEVSAWTDEVDEETRKARRVVMGLRRVFSTTGRAPMEGVQFHPESFLTLEGPVLLANFLSMGGRRVTARALASPM